MNSGPISIYGDVEESLGRLALKVGAEFGRKKLQHRSKIATSPVPLQRGKHGAVPRPNFAKTICNLESWRGNMPAVRAM